MDPYIERPAIWADFHDALVTAIRGALQPLLRPRFAAVMQDRIYVVEAERSRKPDVSIVRLRNEPTAGTAAAVLDVDAPAVFEVWREEIRQPLVHIIEPAADGRLVTAIDVLSPDNKVPGPGRTSYLAKREEYWSGGANLIEIDLLRTGEPTVRLLREELDSLQPWRYLVAVSRFPHRHEIYAIELTRRLPKIAVPLSHDVADVPLDLQAAFERSWEEGAYPELLRYDGPPPGPISEAELKWCRERIAASGYQQAP
jgi:hypothetical protein